MFPLLAAQLLVTAVSIWIGVRALSGIEFTNIQSYEEFFDTDPSSREGLEFILDNLQFDWGLISQGILVAIVGTIIGIVLSLAAAYILLQRRHNNSVETPLALSVAVKRLLPFIGWSFVAWLLWVVPVLIFIFGVFALTIIVSGAFGFLFIGILALIPLAIWYYVKTNFLAIAAVSDRRTTSIWKSTFDTSKGNFFPVLGRLILAFLIIAIPSFIINLIFQTGTSFGVETTSDDVLVNGVPIEELDTVNIGELIGELGGVSFVPLLITTAIGVAIGWFETSMFAGLYAQYNNEEAQVI